MIVKIIDCKLRKNKRKWRVNQNTTVMLFNYYNCSVEWLYRNIEGIKPFIKLQKNTKIIIIK